MDYNWCCLGSNTISRREHSYGLRNSSAYFGMGCSLRLVSSIMPSHLLVWTIFVDLLACLLLLFEADIWASAIKVENSDGKKCVANNKMGELITILKAQLIMSVVLSSWVVEKINMDYSCTEHRRSLVSGLVSAVPAQNRKSFGSRIDL